MRSGDGCFNVTADAVGSGRLVAVVVGASWINTVAVRWLNDLLYNQQNSIKTKATHQNDASLFL